MTDRNELERLKPMTTEEKALSLVNEVRVERGLSAENPLVDPLVGQRRNFSVWEALCRAIEAHEAFRQEVSDAVESRWMNILAMKCEDVFSRFIIPKPDPLVDAWMDAFPGNHIDDAREECAKINAALAARGLEIREKQP